MRMNSLKSLTGLDDYTDGVAYRWSPNPDVTARTWVTVPEQAATGRYLIPFRITWGDRYLGQFRYAVVNVR